MTDDELDKMEQQARKMFKRALTDLMAVRIMRAQKAATPGVGHG